MPVPVIVVGNLIAGGVGKTPMVAWLADTLRMRGWSPGIISRGYGGTLQAKDSARLIQPDTDEASAVGDEPLLLAQRTDAPVCISPNRVLAAQTLLLECPWINVIISDDGLQHYRLKRDFELVVFDQRGAGNQHVLPAGPLREPLQRLSSADALLINGALSTEAVLSLQQQSALPLFRMVLMPAAFHRLDTPEFVLDESALKIRLAGRRLCAIAGLGYPARFFNTLRSMGFSFEEHPFPDHHPYTPDDLAFAHDAVLLMTEKDAVKCRDIFPGEAWVLPVTAEVTPNLADYLTEKIFGRSIA